MGTELNKLPTVGEDELADKGVVSLADRPNLPASYGEGGLSASKLKAKFDLLAQTIGEKLNALSKALGSEGALDYIPVGEAITATYSDTNKTKVIVTLGDLVRAVESGLLADLIRVNFNSSTASLQVAINLILESIGTNRTDIGLLKAMEITETKDGNEDPVYYLAFNGTTHGKSITIPLSDIKKLQDRATDIETEIGEVDGRGGTLWNRLIAAEYDIDNLQSAVGTDGTSGTIKGRIKAVEGRTDTAEVDISTLKGRANAISSQLSSLSDRTTTAETNIVNLEKRVNGLDILSWVDFSEATDTLTFGFSSGMQVHIKLDDFIDSAELKAKLESNIVAEFKAELDAHAEALKAPISALEQSASTSASNASASAEDSRRYAENAEASAEQAMMYETHAGQATSAANTFSVSARESSVMASEYAEQARASASVASDAASRLSVFDKRLQNVENGISPDPFYTDDTVAYQKDVPARALPFAALERLGGMSYKSKNLFGGDPWREGVIAAGGGVPFSGAVQIAASKIGGFKTPITFKENTRYTIVITGYNADGLTFMNMYIKYTDGTSSQMYFAEGTNKQQVVSVSISGKTIAYVGGTWLNGSTVFFPDECGIFEGVLTAEEFEPYFEGVRHVAATSIVSASNNLIPFPYKEGAKVSNGIAFTPNSDGSVTINGTATGRSTYNLCSGLVGVFNKGTYTFSIDASGLGITLGIYATKSGVSAIDTGTTSTRTVEIPEDGMSMRLQFVVTEGNTIDNVTIYPRANIGTIALPYEQYFKETFAIPEEYYLSLYGYGLGISADVHNYIDLALNKYKQMCSIRTYQSGDENNPEVITDGTNTVYPLSSPVETDIAPIDNYIRVGGGGTLTFVNEHSMAVPSTVSYLLKEASV